MQGCQVGQINHHLILKLQTKISYNESPRSIKLNQVLANKSIEPQLYLVSYEGNLKEVLDRTVEK